MTSSHETRDQNDPILPIGKRVRVYIAVVTQTREPHFVGTLTQNVNNEYDVEDESGRKKSLGRLFMKPMRLSREEWEKKRSGGELKSGEMDLYQCEFVSTQTGMTNFFWIVKEL